MVASVHIYKSTNINNNFSITFSDDGIQNPPIYIDSNDSQDSLKEKLTQYNLQEKFCISHNTNDRKFLLAKLRPESESKSDSDCDESVKSFIEINYRYQTPKVKFITNYGSRDQQELSKEELSKEELSKEELSEELYLNDIIRINLQPIPRRLTARQSRNKAVLGVLALIALFVGILLLGASLKYGALFGAVVLLGMSFFTILPIVYNDRIESVKNEFIVRLDRDEQKEFKNKIRTQKQKYNFGTNNPSTGASPIVDTQNDEVIIDSDDNIDSSNRSKLESKYSKTHDISHA